MVIDFITRELKAHTSHSIQNIPLRVTTHCKEYVLWYHPRLVISPNVCESLKLS